MNLCESCPIRLFNKHYHLQGVGNPYFGNCVVIPNVDYNAYKKGDMGFSSQVSVINQVLHSSTGEGDSLDNLDNLDSLSKLYVVPLIRCNESISCELDDNSYNRCLQYFANDIRKYQFKDIMLLGDAARRFLHCDIKDNIDNLFISSNNRRYVVNYAPLVKYTNDSLFDVFKSKLIKWYSSINNKDYSQYKIYSI